MIIRKAYTGQDYITKFIELTELNFGQIKTKYREYLNKEDKLFFLSFEFFIALELDNIIAKELKTIEKKTTKGDVIRNCPVCGLAIAKNYRRQDLGMEWWCKKGHFSVRALNKEEEHIRCKFCNDELVENYNPKDKTKPFWCFKCKEWKNRQGEGTIR